MKKFTKVLVLAMLLAFVASVAVFATGCAPEDDYDFKVGIIHLGDPGEGSGFSFIHEQGIIAMRDKLGLDDAQIVRQIGVDDQNKPAVKNAIQNCIDAGCNIIFATSYDYMEPMDEMSKENPDVIFSHGTGYMSNETNFNNYFGRIYQARYLAGIAAGLKVKELVAADSTLNKKMGYVAAFGTTLAETCSGINAFALGAQAVDSDISLSVKVLESWYDPPGETAAAEALYDEGCLVIAQHCDTPAPQVIAQEKGIFGCGYNSDMTADAPDAHLTAPVWNYGVYYTAAVEAAMKGKEYFMENIGQAWYGGLLEGFVDVSPLSKNCAEGTQDAINKVKALMVDKNDPFNVFEGTKLTITINGTTATVERNAADLGFLIKNHKDAADLEIKAGDASADDGVIKGTMNQYVAGVSE